MKNESNVFKSGFVSLIGRPNVGKSTLLNALIGTKISITSPKAQTTRNIIEGVYHREDAQIVFVDTPGIHKPHHELGSIMTKEALSAIKGMDCVLFMTDAHETIPQMDKEIMDKFKGTNTPVFLVINKLDTYKNNSELDKVILEYMKYYPFSMVVPISARENLHLNHLIDEIVKVLQPGPKYFPDEQITDQPERFLISEIIREKILYFTEQEIPHSVAVIVEKCSPDEFQPDLLDISATIIVERDSQKGIIIGKNGDMLKKIGTAARKELVKLLNSKIHLETWVKVKKDWRNRKMDLKNFGYYENKE